MPVNDTKQHNQQQLAEYPLRAAILHTIIYFDLYDFAPTLLEIEKWLLQNTWMLGNTETTGAPQKKCTLTEIRAALERDNRITQKDGVYMLAGKEALAQTRKEKYSWTDIKWKHAKPMLRLLAVMPFVEGIWFANSMGWGNARKESDIDLFIVTAPGRIWSARFFTTALMKMLRQRPHEQAHEKALCLSFYVSRSHLSLKRYALANNDIHFTFWATQLYPLYDTGAYADYIRENHWASSAFRSLQWTMPIQKRLVHLSRLERAIKKMLEWCAPEKILKHIQLRILPERLRTLMNTDTRVVMTDEILKLHDNDSREKQNAEWQARIQRYANAEEATHP